MMKMNTNETTIDIIFNNMILDNNKCTLKEPMTNSWLTMLSPYTNTENFIKDKVILVTQFYIDNNSGRQREILETLKFNLNNSNIDEILLFNERHYNEEEMMIVNNKNKSKIKQVIINKRLKFNDVFEYIDNNNLKGYILLANSDIFFDNTLTNIFKSNLKKEKKIFTQLRFEYKKPRAHLFGPRGDSQDTWIFHTDKNIKKSSQKLFNFEMGTPGCDNHIVYLFMVLGYNVHNEPYLIKTYHNHSTQKRNYNNKTVRTTKPWIRLIPFLNNNYPKFNKYTDNWWRFNFVHENRHLFSYIEKQIINNKKFIIPRINGLETHFIYLGSKILKTNSNNKSDLDFLNNNKNILRDKEGVIIDKIDLLLEFTKSYLDCMNKSDSFFELEPGTVDYRQVSQGHNFLITSFSYKQTYSMQTLEIFNNIFNNPWTLALKNKRILIISSNISIVENSKNHGKNIYGIDLFPGCSFEFIEAPQINSNLKSYNIELNNLMEKIENIKDKFDIALLASGGFDNIIAGKLYDIDRSAICVGNLLYSYFGIYNKQLMETKGCILKLFMNKYWTLLR